LGGGFALNATAPFAGWDRLANPVWANIGPLKLNFLGIWDYR
jgi:hypothetical protein